MRLVTQDGTRVSYDAVAASYAEALSDELSRKPLNRALAAPTSWPGPVNGRLSSGGR